MNSTTAICKVYTAFLPVLSRKFLRSSPPQKTTNSTITCKNYRVVWEMCCRARKWAQQKKDFMAFLFNTRSYSDTFWSCWVTESDPVFCVARCAKASWFAWMWPSLLTYISLHLLNSFLPAGKWPCCPYSTCSFKGSGICLAQFTECTITINIILKPSEVFFSPFWYFLLLLVLIVQYYGCFFQCSLSGTGLFTGRNVSLLLSLLLGTTDVDGVLEFV